MIRYSLAPALAILLALSANALAFECPAPAPTNDPKVAASIAEILPKDTDLSAPDAVDSAVFDLKQAGVPDDTIVDNLVSVYCGSVATLEDVSDADKAQRIDAFSKSASEAVFGPAD